MHVNGISPEGANPEDTLALGFWLRTERELAPGGSSHLAEVLCCSGPRNQPDSESSQAPRGVAVRERLGEGVRAAPLGGTFGQVRRWFTQGWRQRAGGRRPETEEQKQQGARWPECRRVRRQNRAEEPASGGHGGRRGSRRGHGIVCTGRVRRGAVGTAATPSGSDRTHATRGSSGVAREWGASRVRGLGGSCWGCEKPESRKTDQNLSLHLATLRTTGPWRDALWTAVRGGGK